MTDVNKLCYTRNMTGITKFLHERNMTQAELADQLGVDESLISHIMAGRRRITPGFRYIWLDTFGIAALRFLNDYEAESNDA